jgi:triacylglycerol lipase
MSRSSNALLASLLSSFALTLSLPAAAANNHPLVLVSGFLGFGPDQYKDSGFLYWGGFNDIVGHLRANGAHQVLAANIAPIGSNWDRAVELYYQVKGGCVDYGRAHSVKHAHRDAVQKPAGKCWAADASHNPGHYPLAFYPQWDASHPIHLIGHSQGGTTIRALIELLEHGSADDEGGGELFSGGKVGWVLSATTISAPHNGTTLRDAVLDFSPMMAAWNNQVAQLAHGQTTLWGGAETQPNNLLSDYDSAQLELAPDGARDFNAWARTSPQVYYFSVATRATEAGAACCNQTDRLIAPLQSKAYQYPRADMMFFFKPAAGEWIAPLRLQRGMGSYTQSAPGRVQVDSSWFPNDGVVNTISMRAPAGHPQRTYDGNAVRGSWNFLREYNGYDHFDVLGWPGLARSAYPVYDQIASIVYGL